MIRRDRKYRLAAAIVAAAQALVFGGVYYLNCGSFDEPLQMPPCDPWLPSVVHAHIWSLVGLAPWLVESGAWVLGRPPAAERER